MMAKNANVLPCVGLKNVCHACVIQRCNTQSMHVLRDVVLVTAISHTFHVPISVEDVHRTMCYHVFCDSNSTPHVTIC